MEAAARCRVTNSTRQLSRSIGFVDVGPTSQDPRMLVSPQCDERNSSSPWSGTGISCSQSSITSNGCASPLHGRPPDVLYTGPGVSKTAHTLPPISMLRYPMAVYTGRLGAGCDGLQALEALTHCPTPATSTSPAPAHTQGPSIRHISDRAPPANPNDRPGGRTHSHLHVQRQAQNSHGHRVPNTFPGVATVSMRELAALPPLYCQVGLLLRTYSTASRG